MNKLFVEISKTHANKLFGSICISDMIAVSHSVICMKSGENS